MARMSIATIDKPEFINIKPYNPLISQCEIKVLYIGENRNKSYITKEVAKEMANSLPGNPIVGYFKEDVNDFRDHGDKVTIDHDGVHFECMTRPYGFVAPDAKVWFQKFEETDEFGNTCIREYLMTTGFLWTGQYPECQVAATEEGRPHSMELDKDTLDGKWAKNRKTGMDFFIINDAIFSKLCILGEDVEPCFEGSSVTAPQVSASFSLDDDFTKTLFDMMQELKFALKGEQNMFEDMNQEVQSSFDASENKKEEVETPVEDYQKVDESKEDEEKKEEKFAKEEEEEDKKDDSSKEDDEEKEDKFAKKEEEEKSEDKEEQSSEDKKEEDEEKKKYSLLVEEYDSLKDKYSDLESKYNELLAFKNQIEDEKKTALIDSFYMLSEEDKKEVVENKANYSLDDIEAKLSVICVRKKVNFDLDDNSKFEENKKDENPITTFNLESEVTSTPAWVSAVKNIQKSRNI